LFHRILLYRLNHLVVTQGFPDGGFFFRRALWDNGIGILRVVITLPDGQTALALDLGDIEAGDFEAVPGFYEGLQLLIGGRGLCSGQREVLVG